MNVKDLIHDLLEMDMDKEVFIEVRCKDGDTRTVVVTDVSLDLDHDVIISGD